MKQKPPSTAAIQELTLEWIPSAMRTRMDQAQVRISLAQWQMLPVPERESLARMSADGSVSHGDFVQALHNLLTRSGAGPARPEPAG